MKRRSISARERARLFVLHKGICHLCTRKIVPGEKWHVEHDKPVGLGGTEDDKNKKLAHVDCHAPKTARDVGMMAKADRQRAKHLGIKPQSRHIVPGSRASRLKKHLNGRVTLRSRVDRGV